MAQLTLYSSYHLKLYLILWLSCRLPDRVATRPGWHDGATACSYTQHEGRHQREADRRGRANMINADSMTVRLPAGTRNMRVDTKGKQTDDTLRRSSTLMAWWCDYLQARTTWGSIPMESWQTTCRKDHQHWWHDGATACSHVQHEGRSQRKADRRRAANMNNTDVRIILFKVTESGSNSIKLWNWSIWKIVIDVCIRN